MRIPLTLAALAVVGAFVWLLGADGGGGPPVGMTASESPPAVVPAAPIAREPGTVPVVRDDIARRISVTSDSIVVADAESGAPIADAVVELVEAEGRQLGVLRTDGAGRVVRPALAFDGLAVTAAGHGLVSTPAAAELVRLPRLAWIDVEVLVADAALRDFTFGVRVGHYRSRSDLEDLAVACFQRSVHDRIVWLDGARARVPHPLPAPGTVAVSAVHRSTGVTRELATSDFAANTRALTIDLRESATLQDAWVGVRVHLPMPVAGMFRAKLLPSLGRSAATSEPIDGRTSMVVASFGGHGGDAMLADVYAGDGDVAFVATDVEVRLDSHQVVDVAPWTAHGRIEVTVTGLAPTLAQSLPIDVLGLDDEGERADPPHSRARLGGGRWRFGCLPDGVYRLSVASTFTEDLGVAIEPVEVTIESGNAAFVTLHAAR